MEPEEIFSIVFVSVALLIPFALGIGLWRAVGNRKELEANLAKAKRSSGRVVGYTERTYDSENVRHHYAVIEYITDQNEVVWAETGPCNRDDYAIDSQLDVIAHPEDGSMVLVVANESALRLRIAFEKNLILVVNVSFMLLIAAAIFYESGFNFTVVSSLLLSYSFGFLFGAITKNKSRLEKRLRKQDRESRSVRLASAQAKGEIPCYLNE